MQHFLCGGFRVRFGKPFRSGTSNFDELENRKNSQTQSFFFDAHPQNILRCMICSKTKGSPVEKPSANGVLTSPQKEEQKRNVREEKRKDRNNFWKTSIFERKTECGKEGKMKRKHVKSLDKKRKKKERSEKLRLVKMNHTNTICCRRSLFGNQCHWGCCAFRCWKTKNRFCCCCLGFMVAQFSYLRVLFWLQTYGMVRNGSVHILPGKRFGVGR